MIFLSEIKRAFMNRTFIAILLILSAIVSYDVWITIRGSLSEDGVLLPSEASVYRLWLGFKEYSTISGWFIMLLPLLAVLPYGTSIAFERRYHFFTVMIQRVNKQVYIIAKLLAAFLSGACIVSWPFYLHYQLLSLQYPRWPLYYTMVTISADPFHLELFRNPSLFIWQTIGLIALYGGTVATIAVAISLWLRNLFVVTITPFLLCLLVSIFVELLGVRHYSLFVFLAPMGDVMNGQFALLQMVAIACSVIGCTFILALRMGRQDEMD